jgi:type IV pilus assembly protein PilM
MFTNPFHNAFGLNINDQSIKLVQLKNVSTGKRVPTYRYVTHKETRLPEGLIIKGELIEPETVRKYILHLLRDGKQHKERINGNWAVVSVPSEQSFLRHIQLQKPAKDVIEADVLIHAKQHIPFSENDYFIDWQIVSTNPGSDVTDVLISAIPKHIATLYTYLIESLGLGVIALEIEDLAIARSMITYGKVYEGEARAILDIGASRSTLIVYDHDIIQFSITLQFSGDALTKNIASELKLFEEEAEKKKKKFGVDYKKHKGEQFRITKRMVDDLVIEIQKALHFYETHFDSPNKVTHITMCGGGSNLSKLDTVLTEKLGIEAALGHVWKNLHNTHHLPKIHESQVSLASAIGLALRAADNPYSYKDII